NEVIFAIHNLTMPYARDPAREGDSIADLRLRKAIKEHRAWLSMDILDPKRSSRENYQFVARTLAHLIGPECLALYHPPRKVLVPCTDGTAAQLQSEDPIQAVFGVSQVPVIPVEQGDPRLKTAEAEARKRFPEFEEAFRQKRGSAFSIKAPILYEGETE